MVAVVAASILALTAGTMLWYGYLGWKRENEAVELQRDMGAAMDVLTRAIRSGTNMTFAAGPVFTVQFDSKPTASIFTSGNNLVYDPDTSVSGDQTALVNGRLRRFDISMNTNMVTVVLLLQTAQETLSNSVSISRRN